MAQGDICQIDKYCSTEKQAPVRSRYGVLCGKHRYQMRRHGQIYKTAYEPRLAVIEDGVAKIPLGMGAKHGFAIVDASFAHLAVDKWDTTTNGYVVCSARRNLSLHRAIAGAKSGEVVDHINGNKLDCRLSNLRICTQSENARNQKVGARNTTGYKGVTKTKGGKFTARIKKDYIYRHIGVFTSAAKAALAYNEAAKNLHGEFARLNDVR